MSDDDTSGAGVDPSDAELDWFGNPVAGRREPVPCAHCERTFTARAPYVAHLRADHGVTASGTPRPSTIPRWPSDPLASTRAAPAALGREPRRPLGRRLATVPLLLVVALNVAVGLAVVTGLEQVGPAWWSELSTQSWYRLAVFVPMMWPTVLFLALRDT